MHAGDRQAARAAEANGATLTDLEFPEILQEAYRAQFIIQDFEAFRSLAFEYDNHRDQTSPALHVAANSLIGPRRSP